MNLVRELQPICSIQSYTALHRVLDMGVLCDGIALKMPCQRCISRRDMTLRVLYLLEAPCDIPPGICQTVEWVKPSVLRRMSCPIIPLGYGEAVVSSCLSTRWLKAMQATKSGATHNSSLTGAQISVGLIDYRKYNSELTDARDISSVCRPSRCTISAARHSDIANRRNLLRG